MPARQLYTLTIPANAQMSTSSRQSRNLSKQGILGGASPAVESLSLDPGQFLLTGQFRGLYSELMAAEVEELFNAGGIDVVPFYSTDGQTGKDGYYALDNVTVEPIDPRATGLNRYDGTITRRGGRATHFRTLRTNPGQVTHNWGNGTSALTPLPTAATRVRWFDRSTKSREPATPVETRTTQFGDVTVYDAASSAYSSPELIFDLSYDREGLVDCRVYDTHNRPKSDVLASGATVGSATVGDDFVAGETTISNTWAHVFSTGHEFVGTRLVENGLLRLDLDDGHRLRAYEWDDATGEYGRLALGDSSWRLYHTSIAHISPSRIDMRLEFEDTAGSSFYSLDAVLRRGMDSVLFSVPSTESGPVPQALVDRLDAIADPSVVDPGEALGLLAHEEVA